jgi:hypothetical protein
MLNRILNVFNGEIHTVERFLNLGIENYLQDTPFCSFLSLRRSKYR